MADVPAIRITAIDDASKVIDQIGRSLTGLVASVVSVGAAMATFKAALDFGDQLQTMNEKLGISVEKLQELSAIAVQSGTGLEGFGKAYKALAQSMTAAQNATSEQARLFKALGVAVTDAQGNMRPLEDVMADSADALNAVGNETTRTSAGIVIMGKGYLEVAAALRTYRTAQAAAQEIIREFGTVSREAAKAADDLGDRIKLIWEGVKVGTLNEMTGGLSAMNLTMKELQPRIAEFAQEFGRFIDWVMSTAGPALIILADSTQRLGMTIGAMGAAWAAESKEQRLRIYAEFNEDIKRMEATAIASLKRLEAIKAGKGVPRTRADDLEVMSRQMAQNAVDSKAVQGALTTGVNKTTEALEAMVKSQEAALASELKLSEVDKLYIALTSMKLGTMKGYNLELVKRLTLDAQQRDLAKAAAEAAKDETERLKAQAEAFMADSVAAKQLGDAYQLRIKASEDIVKNLEFEVEAMQMSNDERELAIALRAQEATGVKLVGQALEDYTNQLKSLISQKSALQQQVDLWGKIDAAAHDAFTHIYEGGKSVFDRLLNSIKQIGLELAYLAAKRWVINLALGTGGAGGAGNAFASLGNLFGGGAGPMSSGGWTSFEGASSIKELTAGSITSFISTNAIPIVGTLLAVGGGLIYNWLEGKKGGPKTGGFATSGAIGMLGGYKDSSGRWITPSDADAQLKQYTDATLKSYNDFAKAFGVKALVGFAQGFTSDPQGTAGNILHTQAFVNGKSVYEVAIGDLGRDSKELADRMALENKRALIAALQGSDLPGVLSKLFANLVPTTITGEIADSILTFAGAYKNLYDVFNANPLDDALNAVADAAEGAQRAVEKQGEALLDLLAIYDGTGDSTTALATATQAYYGNVVALIAQMEQLKQTIADMFASSIKQFTFAKLDKGGQYKYLQADVTSAYGQLQTSTSAMEIDRVTKQIDAAMREMFGLLSPQEQKQQADKFIANAARINETAQAQLAKAQQAQEDRLNAILTAIRTAIDQAAANLSGSADDLSNAADDLSDAVGTQQPATVNG